MLSVMVLLASQMLMISDRGEFWDANVVSKQTEINYVDSEGVVDPSKQGMDRLKGKKVLVLIHGFNNSKADVLSAYFMTKEQIDRCCVSSKGDIYDEIIGYVWPGCQSRLDFYKAEEHAKKVSGRVTELLTQMTATADQVDVMAHSMGNFLFLEALNKSSKLNGVTNFFSLGAAVDDASIEKGGIYGAALKRCRDVYIAYSSEDDVLKYLYTLAEFGRALGSVGVPDISQLPSRVQLVNCTDVVAGHSDYSQSPQLYTFLRDRLLGIAPLPENAKSVKLFADNRVLVVVPAVSN